MLTSTPVMDSKASFSGDDRFSIRRQRLMHPPMHRFCTNNDEDRLSSIRKSASDNQILPDTPTFSLLEEFKEEDSFKTAIDELHDSVESLKASISRNFDLKSSRFNNIESYYTPAPRELNNRVPKELIQMTSNDTNSLSKRSTLETKRQLNYDLKGSSSNNITVIRGTYRGKLSEHSYCVTNLTETPKRKKAMILPKNVTAKLEDSQLNSNAKKVEKSNDLRKLVPKAETTGRAVPTRTSPVITRSYSKKISANRKSNEIEKLTSRTKIIKLAPKTQSTRNVTSKTGNSKTSSRKRVTKNPELTPEKSVAKTVRSKRTAKTANSETSLIKRVTNNPKTTTDKAVAKKAKTKSNSTAKILTKKQNTQASPSERILLRSMTVPAGRVRGKQ